MNAPRSESDRNLWYALVDEARAAGSGMSERVHLLVERRRTAAKWFVLTAALYFLALWWTR